MYTGGLESLCHPFPHLKPGVMVLYGTKCYNAESRHVVFKELKHFFFLSLSLSSPLPLTFSASLLFLADSTLTDLPLKA